MSAYKDAAKSAIEEISQVGNAFELARKGVISKKEALHLYNEILGDSFGIQTDFNKAEKVFRDKTEAYIQATALRAQANALLSKAAEEQAKALSASLEDQTSFLDKATASLYDLFGETLSGSKELFRAQVAEENQIKKIANERSNKFNELAKSLLKEAELVENKNGIISANEKATIDQIKEQQKKLAEARKEALEKIKAAEKEYSDSFLSQKQVEINSETKKYNDLIKLAEKYGYDTTNLRLALKNALNDIEGKYGQQELDLNDKIEREKLEKYRETYNKKEALRRADIQQEESFFEEYSTALLTQQQAEERAVTDKYFNLIEQAKKYGLDISVLEQKQQKELAEIRQKYDLERINKMIEQAQKVKDMVGQIFQVITDFENIRLQEIENNTNAELAALDKKYQDELNKGNLNAEQKAALDKNYAAAKYATELKAFNEMEKIKKRQFNRDKALRIAQVSIDTAAAVSKSVAASPLTFGMPWSAAAIGIGLAQIAAIAATKYESGTAPSISGGGTGISAGATGSELGGAAVNGSLAGQQMSTAELVSQTNQGNVYVLESDITGTQNKVATQNKLSVW